MLLDEVQTEEEKAVKVGFGRLLNLNRREWPYLAAGILASAAIGTVQPIFAIILSKVTALLTPDEPASNILRFCTFFFALAAAQLACGSLQVRSVDRVGGGRWCADGCRLCSAPSGHRSTCR